PPPNLIRGAAASAAPELPATPRSVCNLTSNAVPLGNTPFVGIHVTVQTNQVLVARRGNLMRWTPFAPPPSMVSIRAFVNLGAFASAIAVAPSNPTNVWWCGNAAGEVWMTGNAGGAWTNATVALLAIGHTAT